MGGDGRGGRFGGRTSGGGVVGSSGGVGTHAYTPSSISSVQILQSSVYRVPFTLESPSELISLIFSILHLRTHPAGNGPLP